MKKVELKGKLSLNKVTIAKLNEKQMDNVKGGRITWSLSWGNACQTSECTLISHCC